MHPLEAFPVAMRLFTENQPTFTTAHGRNHGGGWANLPKELLYYLMKFLNFRTDILRLRAVCRRWRASLPVKEIPKLPLGFDAPNIPTSNHPTLMTTHIYYLVSPLTTTESNSPKSPWIVRVSYLTRSVDRNKFELHNPIIGGVFFSLKPPLRGEFNLLDCNVEELHTTFSLLGGAKNLFNTPLKNLADKVVGSRDLTSNYVYVVLAKIKVEFGGGLIFLRMGMNFWRNITEMNLIDEKKSILRNLDVGDIAFYDGEFYVLDFTSWKIGIIDVNDLRLDEEATVEFMDGPPGIVYWPFNRVQFVRVDGVQYALKGTHLVPSKNGLYLVLELSKFDRFIAESVVVYNLDEEEWVWERVDDIGDQIFFVGLDTAFSIAAESLPRWKAGSICLFNQLPTPFNIGFAAVGKDEMPEGLECLKSIEYLKYWKGFRLFNMDEQEKGIVSFAELSREVYTGLFFPPPPWVRWTCPAAENVEVKLKNLKVSDGGYDDGISVNGGSAKKGALVLEEVE